MQAVEEMKTSVEQLNRDITNAKTRHAEASKDIKRIENDINDFSNNKDNKLAELQRSLNVIQKSQTKHAISAKTLQKELQGTRLDAEQVNADLSSTQEQLLEFDSVLRNQQTEIDALHQEQAQVKV